MSLGVLNNISAIYAQNNLNNSQSSLQKTLQQLSSGSRINSGADDAAGLSLSDALSASSTALSQSAKNASEGVDFLQVADGAMAQVTSLLNRAVTLATEAANGTLNSTQVSATQAEYSSILSEINTISSNTEYNGINVFSSAVNVFTADGTVSQSYSTSKLGKVDSTAIGLATQVITGTNAAATATGVDSLGNSIAVGDNVLTASGKTYNLKTSTAVNIALNGSSITALSTTNAANNSLSAAVAGQNGSTDANGVTIATGDNLYQDSKGNLFDLKTATSGTAAVSLTTQSGAQSALNGITQAIASVASSRGNAGAAINTLQAVGQVMSTQSTNVLSAQNDVLATDYGTATSNMSKYQILMQTGISALAQANSTQQLVTKLLQ